jgi:hypothetical protein
MSPTLVQNTIVNNQGQDFHIWPIFVEMIHKIAMSQTINYNIVQWHFEKLGHLGKINSTHKFVINNRNKTNHTHELNI